MTRHRAGKGPKRPERWDPRRTAGRPVARTMADSSHCASGANGIRTRDLLLAKQALSQLSYGPDSGSSLGT
jgi:hypothetical protein